MEPTSRRPTPGGQAETWMGKPTGVAGGAAKPSAATATGEDTGWWPAGLYEPHTVTGNGAGGRPRWGAGGALVGG